MEPQGQHFIDAQGLSLRVPHGYVFHDVSLTVDEHQVVGVFGSEGSGKTSLLLTLAGRMRFTGGQATIAGYDLRKNCRKVRDLSGITIIERINDVPENLSVYDILAAELQLAGKKSNRDAVLGYLDQWKFRDHEKIAYRSLPSNERSLFGMMLACTTDPKLLLVDDIQIGLTQHRAISLVKKFKEITEERDMTVLFGVSEYDIAKHADGVIVMSQKAEKQRCDVINDQGMSASAPVFGSSADVTIDASVGNPFGIQGVA